MKTMELAGRIVEKLLNLTGQMDIDWVASLLVLVDLLLLLLRILTTVLIITFQKVF